MNNIPLMSLAFLLVSRESTGGFPCEGAISDADEHNENDRKINEQGTSCHCQSLKLVSPNGKMKN